MSKKKSKATEKESANGKTKAPQQKKDRLDKQFYEEELARLQFELVKMQYWIKEKKMRVVITFDGRDAAGKGGVIKRIIEPMDARGVRLVALGKPSDVERTQSVTP